VVEAERIEFVQRNLRLPHGLALGLAHDPGLFLIELADAVQRRHPAAALFLVRSSRQANAPLCSNRRAVASYLQRRRKLQLSPVYFRALSAVADSHLHKSRQTRLPPPGSPARVRK